MAMGLVKTHQKELARFVDMPAASRQGLRLLDEPPDGRGPDLASLVADVHAQPGGRVMDQPDAAANFLGREPRAQPLQTLAQARLGQEIFAQVRQPDPPPLGIEGEALAAELHRFLSTARRTTSSKTPYLHTPSRRTPSLCMPIFSSTRAEARLRASWWAQMRMSSGCSQAVEPTGRHSRVSEMQRRATQHVRADGWSVSFLSQPEPNAYTICCGTGQRLAPWRGALFSVWHSKQKQNATSETFLHGNQPAKSHFCRDWMIFGPLSSVLLLGKADFLDVASQQAVFSRQVFLNCLGISFRDVFSNQLPCAI